MSKTRLRSCLYAALLSLIAISIAILYNRATAIYDRASHSPPLPQQSVVQLVCDNLTTNNAWVWQEYTCVGVLPAGGQLTAAILVPDASMFITVVTVSDDNDIVGVNGIWLPPVPQGTARLWVIDNPKAINREQSPFNDLAVRDAQKYVSREIRDLLFAQSSSDSQYRQRARDLTRQCRHNKMLLVATCNMLTFMSTPSGVELSLVQPATFIGERGRPCTVTSPFWVGRTEVTTQQYIDAMEKSAAPIVASTLIPATHVTWYDAVAWCKAMSDADDVPYRLPTEAEWEVACRAGGGMLYSPNLPPNQFMWYNENSDVRLHEVAILQPNSYGIYDMHGNANEWCSDWYSSQHPPGGTDPRGPASGDQKVRRGGAYDNYGSSCMCNARDAISPDVGVDKGGFRVIVDGEALFPLEMIDK